MKLLIVFALVVAAIARPDEAHYDEKFDHFNVDELVQNDRLLKSYTHCFIGDGKCTPEGNDIKALIPEATATSCKKCTEKQKELVAKCVKAIQEKLPADWEVLEKKVDPEGKYTEDLKKFVAKYAH